MWEGIDYSWVIDAFEKQRARWREEELVAKKLEEKRRIDLKNFKLIYCPITGLDYKTTELLIQQANERIEMNKQLNIEFEDATPNKLTLSNLSFGSLFVRGQDKTVYLKVKSTNFLNNSNLLSDVFARGDCLVVNIKAGTVFVMEGSTEVVKLTGNLKVHKA